MSLLGQIFFYDRPLWQLKGSLRGNKCEFEDIISTFGFLLLLLTSYCCTSMDLCCTFLRVYSIDPFKKYATLQAVYEQLSHKIIL